MRLRLVEFLGQKASSLLETEPFNSWPVERIVDDDSAPPLVGYIFTNCGLQFTCDREDERIRSVFVEKEMHDGTKLSEIPFKLRRHEVREEFGSPSKSGERISHPVLGEFGAWDRFENSGFILHVQYHLESDEIQKLTLMRNDVAPE